MHAFRVNLRGIGLMEGEALAPCMFDSIRAHQIHCRSTKQSPERYSVYFVVGLVLSVRYGNADLPTISLSGVRGIQQQQHFTRVLLLYTTTLLLQNTEPVHNYQYQFNALI